MDVISNIFGYNSYYHWHFFSLDEKRMLELLWWKPLLKVVIYKSVNFMGCVGEQITRIFWNNATFEFIRKILTPRRHFF
jgi:hypothetical protein